MPTEPEFKPELIALGQTIRRDRQAQGLSIEALAFKAGVSAGHLGWIERGHGNPRLETAATEHAPTTLTPAGANLKDDNEPTAPITR
jgi:transcriptional regulator with XRE-family HTH domain